MKRAGPPKRKTPMKRGNKPLPRSRLKPKPAAGGFPEEVRVAARQRSGGVCEIGSIACMGRAAHFHHRKLRRSKDHRLVNCLHVCGPCHRYIHDEQPGVAYLMGWLVRQTMRPEDIIVKRGDRWREYH